MIPEGLSKVDIEVITQPSLSYKMVLDSDCIIGKCDRLEAMRQAVYKILNTERYQTLIYSWNYGIELKDLFGKPVRSVVAILEKRIRTALLQDDRVQSVDNFVFDTSKRHIVLATFTVHTTFGNIEASKEVRI